MFSHAVVMVLVLMAVVGTSESSAIKLNESVNCMVQELASNHCPVGKAWLNPIPRPRLKAGTVVKFASTLFTVECASSEIALKVEKNLENSIHGSISEVTFAMCGEKCKAVKATNLPWLASITPTTAGNGSLLASKATGSAGPPAGLIECTFPIVGTLHCVYTSEDLTGVTITGGKPAIVKVETELKKVAGESSAFCPATATWKAEYETPEGLWVALFLDLE